MNQGDTPYRGQFDDRPAGAAGPARPETVSDELLDDAPAGAADMSHQEPFYQELLDNLFDGVYFVDAARRITYWNKGAQRITGYSPERVLGRSCADNLLMHVDDEGNVLCRTECPLAKTIRDGAAREAEVYLHHAQGHRVPVTLRVAPLADEAGRIVGAVETFSDNSRLVAERQRARQFEESALRDALTGAGNRQYVELKLRSRLFEAGEAGPGFGVLFMDIDDFKQVNDLWGHAAGDRVLRMVAETLRHNLRADDVLGRFGGEEFVAVISGASLPHLAAVANKLRALVAQSRLATEAAAGDIQVTISVGATLARPGDTVQSLVQRADGLMYQSKAQGRNRVSAAE